MSWVARLKLPKIGGTMRSVSSATRHVSFILARSSHARAASPPSPLLSAISSCSRTMAARVSGSLARCRTMNVMRMDDVSWPAMSATMELSTISSSLSCAAPLLSSFRLSRHAMRSLLRDASPRSSLAFVSLAMRPITRRALALALRLRRNAVNGRSTGTAHMPPMRCAKSPARASRTGPRPRPKSREEMMSNVRRFMSGITVTVSRSDQHSSRWRRTSPSILPT
ncbi:unnamed protein product [Urochloa decumbens]|uniref:Uncharacterized protein n=1 Tax=Urochloa decumbens TaxID=240449 RepID=A0ABC9ESJ5_9POAL